MWAYYLVNFRYIFFQILDFSVIKVQYLVSPCHFVLKHKTGKQHRLLAPIRERWESCLSTLLTCLIPTRCSAPECCNDIITKRKCYCPDNVRWIDLRSKYVDFTTDNFKSGRFPLFNYFIVNIMLSWLLMEIYIIIRSSLLISNLLLMSVVF